MIYIWEPKYSTNEVLIGAHKVLDGLNDICFTKSKALRGAVYAIQGSKIKSFPKQKNGNGYVYVVPFGELQCIKQPS
jgi:hypothetical protein